MISFIATTLTHVLIISNINWLKNLPQNYWYGLQCVPERPVRFTLFPKICPLTKIYTCKNVYLKGYYLCYVNIIKTTTTIYFGRTQPAHTMPSRFRIKFSKISYVPRDINPPNCPEARFIQKFWSEFKRRVYEDNWQAKSIEQLQTRINGVYSKFGNEIFQKYSEGCHRLVGTISKYGLNKKQ